ncbi:MAG: Spy/CpxP family protein refolding chaperone [Candidatus Binatia bacterium]
MKKLWSLAAIGVLAVSLGAATVYGGGRGGWHGQGRGHGGGFAILGPHLLRKLDLSEEQKTRVQQIRDAHRPAFESAFTELRSLHTQIGDRFFAPGAVQSGDFTPQLARAAELRQQMTQEGLAVALEIRAVLSPEQLAKAGELRAQFQELRQQMKELHGQDR